MSVSQKRSNVTDSYEVLTSYGKSNDELEVAVVDSLVKGTLGTVPNNVYTSPANNSQWDYSRLSNQYVNTSAISNYPTGTMGKNSVLAFEHIPPSSLQTYDVNLGNGNVGNTSNFSMQPTSSSIYDSNYVVTQSYLSKYYENGISQTGTAPSGAKYMAEFDKANSNFTSQYAVNSEWNSTTTYGSGELSTLTGTRPVAVEEDYLFNTTKALGSFDPSVTYVSRYAVPNTQDGSLIFHNIHNDFQPENNNILVQERTNYTGYSDDKDVGIYRCQQQETTSSISISIKLDNVDVNLSDNLSKIPIMDANAQNGVINPNTAKASLNIPGATNLTSSQFNSMFNSHVLNTIADNFKIEMEVSNVTDSGYQINPTEIVNTHNLATGATFNVSNLKLLISLLNNEDLYDNPFYMNNYVDKAHEILFSDSNLNVSVGNNGVATNVSAVNIDLTNGETLLQTMAGVNGEIKINPNTPTTRTTDWSSSGIGNTISQTDVIVNYSGSNVISNDMMTNPYVKVNYEKVALRSSVEPSTNVYLSNNDAFVTLYTNSVVNTQVDNNNTTFTFNKNNFTDDNIRLWRIEAQNNLISQPLSFFREFDETNNAGSNLEPGIVVQSNLQNLAENLLTYESYRLNVVPKQKNDLNLHAQAALTSNWEVIYTGMGDTFLKSSSLNAFNTENHLPKYNLSDIQRLENNETLYYKYEYQTIVTDNVFGGLADYVKVTYSFNENLTNSVSFNIPQTELTRTYRSTPTNVFEVINPSYYSLPLAGAYTTEEYELVRATKTCIFDVAFDPKYGLSSNIHVSIKDIQQTDQYYALKNKNTGLLASRAALNWVTILNSAQITNLTGITEQLSALNGGVLILNGWLRKADLRMHRAVVKGRVQATNNWVDISDTIDFDAFYSLANLNTLTISAGASVSTIAEFAPLNTQSQIVNLDNSVYYIPFIYNPNNVNYTIQSFTSTANNLVLTTDLENNSDSYLNVTDNYSQINNDSWLNTIYTLSVTNNINNTTNFIVKDLQSNTIFEIVKQSNQIFLGTTIVSYIPKDIYRSTIAIGSSSISNTINMVFESTNYASDFMNFSNTPGIQVLVNGKNSVAGSKIGFRLLGDFVSINPVGSIANPTNTQELGNNSYNTGSLTFQYVNGPNYSGKFTFLKIRGYNDSNTGVQEYNIIRPGTSVTFKVGTDLTQVLTSNMFFNQNLIVDDLKNNSNVTCANLNVKCTANYSMPPSGQILNYPVSLKGDNVSFRIINSLYTGLVTDPQVPPESTPIADPKSYFRSTTLVNYGRDNVFTFSGIFSLTNQLIALRPSRIKIKTTSFNHNNLFYKISTGLPAIYIFKAKQPSADCSNWLGDPSLISANDKTILADSSKWTLIYQLTSTAEKNAGVSIGRLHIGQNPNKNTIEAISYFVCTPAYYKFSLVSTLNNISTPYEYSTLSSANKLVTYLPRISPSNGVAVYNPFQTSIVIKDILSNSYTISRNGSHVNNVKFTILNPKTNLELTSTITADNTRYGISVPGVNLSITLNRNLYPSVLSPQVIYQGPITSIPTTPDISTSKIVFRSRTNTTGQINFSVLQFPADIGYTNDLNGYKQVFKSTLQSDYYNIDFKLGNVAWYNNNNPVTYFDTNSTGNRPTLFSVCDVIDPTTKVNSRRVYKYTSIANVDVENYITLQTLSLVFSGGRSYYDVVVTQPTASNPSSTYVWDYTNLVNNTSIGQNVSTIPWTSDGGFNETVYVNFSFGNKVTGQQMPNEIAYVEGQQRKWTNISLLPFLSLKNQFGLDVAEISWDGSITTPLVTTAVVSLKPVLASPALDNNTYQIEQYSTSSLK